MDAPARSIQTAADVMTAGPRTCSLFSSVLEAVMIFRDADCAAVPVVDDGVPVGVLTDRDVALASTEDAVLLDRPVTEIMSKGKVLYEKDHAGMGGQSRKRLRKTRLRSSAGRTGARAQVLAARAQVQ